MQSKSQIDQSDVLASSTIERWFLSKNVERIPVKAGRIRGSLFVPKGQLYAFLKFYSQ